MNFCVGEADDEEIDWWGFLDGFAGGCTVDFVGLVVVVVLLYWIFLWHRLITLFLYYNWIYGYKIQNIIICIFLDFTLFLCLFLLNFFLFLHITFILILLITKETFPLNHILTLNPLLLFQISIVWFSLHIHVDKVFWLDLLCWRRHRLCL